MYSHRIHREDGMALLIAVILLLLISAIGLSALQSASGEAQSGSRSLRKLSTFFAADAAATMLTRQLNSTVNQYPDTTALNDANFIQDQHGYFTAVRTGTADNAVPQSIRLVGHARQEGGALNVNSANTFTFGIYRADVVATDPTGGRVELQAQYSVSEGTDSYK